MEQLIKSNRRVKTYGEVFTPENIVSDMLDMVSKEYNCKLGIDNGSLPLDKTFLEPSCGSGNFLVQILSRKLRSVRKDHLDEDMFIALSSIYGIDIQADNVLESRERMLEICEDFYRKSTGVDMTKEYAKILADVLENNIVLGNTLYEGIQKFELNEKGQVIPIKVLKNYKGGMAHLSNSGEIIKSLVIDKSEIYERMYFYEWTWGSPISKIKRYLDEDDIVVDEKPKTQEDYFSKFAGMFK